MAIRPPTLREIAADLPRRSRCACGSYLQEAAGNKPVRCPGCGKEIREDLRAMTSHRALTARRVATWIVVGGAVIFLLGAGLVILTSAWPTTA